MKIIEPNVELWEQTDVVNHVARCARICYRKETGNDGRLVQNLKLRKHFSMFRHATYYFIIPYKCVPKWLDDYFNAMCFGAKIIGIDIDFVRGIYYVVTNGNWNLNHQGLLIDIKDYIVSAKEFTNAGEVVFNMMRYTFKITTQISTSREFNRVSPNNIAEQSTRYVYEDGTICRPHWLKGYDISQTLHGKYLIYKDGKEDDDINHKVLTFINSCDNSFKNYKYLIDTGLPRQDARGVLPFDTATICAYTYSAAEWRHIIDLRYYGITGKPHPNAKLIAGMIREQLMELGHEFR